MNLSLFFLFITTVATVQADCSLTGLAPGTGSAAEVCRQLGPADIEAAISKAIAEALGPETPIRIEILDHPHQQVPDGEIRFSFHGAPPASFDGTSVVHGKIELRDGRALPVWARVRLMIRRTAAVAVQDLDARILLREGMIEKREVWVPYPEMRPTETDYDVVSLLGSQLKRAVRTGQPVYASYVDLPFDIRRGQTVELHVHSGAAHLRLQATAMQNARRGESVKLRVPDRESQLAAVASGPGSAELQANRTNGETR